MSQEMQKNGTPAVEMSYERREKNCIQTNRESEKLIMATSNQIKR